MSKDLKIAIVTIAYGQNYGNRLQNYALQEVLKSFAGTVETLAFSVTSGLVGFNKLKWFIKEIAKFLIGKPYTFLMLKRDRRIIEFNKKYIQFSSQQISKEPIRRTLGSHYDLFIVGSDQVWNTDSRDVQKNIDIFLLAFVPPEKRISYAASFGNPSIRTEFQQYFKEELSKFKAVSVRESIGVELAAQLGISANVVLDPTMLLSADRWAKIAKKPDYAVNTGFFVTYFLGGRSKELTDYIYQEAKGRIIYNLENEGIGDKNIDRADVYITAPDEFIWLFSHADCILTDSFHGSVFSILFHKPFRVYERYIQGKRSHMESRIDTLLDKFKLNSCRSEIYQPSATEWTEIDLILERERMNSMDFLKNALQISINSKMVDNIRNGDNE